MGTYNCRTIAYPKVGEHIIAIDISKIDGAASNLIGIKKMKKEIYYQMPTKACLHFQCINTDTDRVYHDYFHFDNGYGENVF